MVRVPRTILFNGTAPASTGKAQAILGPNPNRLCWGLFNEDASVALRFGMAEQAPTSAVGTYVPPSSGFVMDCFAVMGTQIISGAATALQVISTGAAVAYSGYEIVYQPDR